MEIICAKPSFDKLRMTGFLMNVKAAQPFLMHPSRFL